MTHFLIMILFSGTVAVVFGLVSPDTSRQRLLYGLKVFGEFVAIGLVLAWLLYFLPL